MSLLKKPLFPKGFSFKFPSSSHAIDDVLKSEDTQNALDVMKSSLTSGSDKKWKKSSKNEAILRLETDLLKNLSNKGIQSNELPALKKMNKNKRKKLKRKLGNVKNV